MIWNIMKWNEMTGMVCPNMGLTRNYFKKKKKKKGNIL